MKTVLCHGCFDPFHYGHLLHLEAARKLGGRLVVSVTSDAHVNKGPRRPVFTDSKRAAVIRALRIVDAVIVSDSAQDAIFATRPDIYCKGVDYIETYLPEREIVEAIGGKVMFTTTDKYSSTELLCAFS